MVGATLAVALDRAGGGLQTTNHVPDVPILLDINGRGLRLGLDMVMAMI